VPGSWTGRGRSSTPRTSALRDVAQKRPSPVDRARPGSKHHFLTEGAGIPLSVSLTGGNRNDVTELEPLLEAVPPVRGRRGRPRQRPDGLYGDRAYDHDKYRKRCVPKASDRASLAEASPTVPVWARSGGWLSALWPGITV
jgi:hypothetical protein